jgi:hypothetical protein
LHCPTMLIVVLAVLPWVIRWQPGWERLREEQGYGHGIRTRRDYLR